MPLPQPFLIRLGQIFDDNTANDVLRVLSKKRKTAFRINTLLAEPEEVVNSLTNQGFVLSPVPWHDFAYVIESLPHYSLSETDEFQSGHIYIQNTSSMIPVIVLDPQPGEKVLDMCAAPGSKTTQIAQQMSNSGEIVANDTSGSRIRRLKETVQNMGCRGVSFTALPGERLWQKYPEQFDRVLVDVPCSMEGRFVTSDPETFTHWSQKKVKSLAKLQNWLLRSAVSATKPGGTVVYSTCTLSPEENEEVITWIIEKEKNHITLESIDLPLTRCPPVLSWNRKSYTPSVKKTMRVLPDDSMEGFFVARIKKVSSNVL